MFKQHITTVYGETTYQSTRKLQTLKRQAAAAKCKWIFLCRCLKHDVLPRSFVTKPVIRTQHAYRETREHNLKMLKITKNDEKKKYDRCLRRIREINNTIRRTVTVEDMERIHNITETSRENVFQSKQKKLKEKFERITAQMNNQQSNNRTQTKIKHDVVDLTKDGIDDDIKAYLRLGPDFSETPKKLPYEKIIIETEKMCKVIEAEMEEAEQTEKHELEREIHSLREKVKKLLMQAKDKKIPSNLTEKERNGRKKAYEDKNRVYLPADKGRVMVAMDKYEQTGGENSYEFKMRKVLEDLKATQATRANEDWDVTEKVSREGRTIVQEIVNRGEISEQKGRWMKPNDCRAPRLTGYPKIHKNNVPLRGVVSFIGSPYENVAKTLVPILRKLQGRSGHYIKNSQELKEKVKNWTILRDEILVSYDVEKLYPSIPIKKALDLIENLLRCKRNLPEITTMSVQSIMKLLRWMFKLTYCEYDNKHYTLDCGPIGLSIVGEVAIIYMEEFQMKVKTDDFPELREWPWYVDDSVLKCKRNRADEILNHLNSQEEEIQFTKEEENDNKLPVLDLHLIVNRKRKKLEFDVYYKKTNTNITLKKQSNHRESTKKGVTKGYADRARKICDPQNLQDELKNIEELHRKRLCKERSAESNERTSEKRTNK